MGDSTAFGMVICNHGTRIGAVLQRICNKSVSIIVAFHLQNPRKRYFNETSTVLSLFCEKPFVHRHFNVDE